MKVLKITFLSAMLHVSNSFAGVSGFVHSNLQMYPGAPLSAYAAEAENGLTLQASMFCKKERSTIQSISNTQIQIVAKFSVQAKARGAYQTSTNDYPYIVSTAQVVCN